MIITNAVVVGPEVAAMLGPALKRWADAWERQAGASLHPEIREFITELDTVGRVVRQRAVEHERNTRNTAERSPAHDAIVFDSLLISTAAAAQVLGISERAVRGRCERGTLSATRTPQGWRIDAVALSLKEAA